MIVRPANNAIPPPSTAVTKLEDAYQKNLSDTLQGLSGLSLSGKTRQHPSRPGYGTRGANVLLWANYFEVATNPALVLYRYNISVSPTVAGKKLIQVVRLLLEGPLANFRDDIVTDFKSILFSRTKLESSIFGVTYKAEGEDEPLPNAPMYQIRPDLDGALTVSELSDFLNSTNINVPDQNNGPILQALNILMGHYAKASPMIAAVGKSKAFPSGQDAQKMPLGTGLIAIKGFFSSVRVAATRILLNVNVTNGAFYDPVPLDQLIQTYSNTHGRNAFSLERFLKRVRVRSTHLPEKKNKAGQTILRVKTISGLATPNDGYNQPHPPKVPAFGAGAEKVQFWWSESTPASGSAPAVPGASSSEPSGKGGKKKGKGKGQPESSKSGSSSEGKYITVLEFFKTGMS